MIFLTVMVWRRKNERVTSLKNILFSIFRLVWGKM